MGSGAQTHSLVHFTAADHPDHHPCMCPARCKNSIHGLHQACKEQAPFRTCLMSSSWPAAVLHGATRNACLLAACCRPLLGPHLAAAVMRSISSGLLRYEVPGRPAPSLVCLAAFAMRF